MEQLVLLLVIAAISLVNWLIERSAKLREQKRLQKESENRGRPAPEAAPPLVPEPSAREEIEEHMRRMMESFGIPVEDSRPASQQPEPVFFEEPAATPPPPPPLLEPVRAARPPIRKSRKATVASRPRSPWTARLGSPQGLREAIVLREILGPPKALSES